MVTIDQNHDTEMNFGKWLVQERYLLIPFVVFLLSIFSGFSYLLYEQGKVLYLAGEAKFVSLEKNLIKLETSMGVKSFQMTNNFGMIKPSIGEVYKIRKTSYGDLSACLKNTESRALLDRIESSCYQLGGNLVAESGAWNKQFNDQKYFPK